MEQHLLELKVAQLKGNQLYAEMQPEVIRPQRRRLLMGQLMYVHLSKERAA